MNAVALVALMVLLVACDTRHEPTIRSLARGAPEPLRDVFDAHADEPRVLVFFSSGCAACDTGSKALQKMLATLPGRVTVLAVWEPIAADDPAPTKKLVRNLPDPRVHQFWDPEHVMSHEMRASELAHPGSAPQVRTRTDNDPEGIMYDTVAIFPAGARWDGTLPAPVFLDVGLKAILPKLRGELERMMR